MAKKIRVWDGTQWQDVAPSLPYTAIHSAQASMPLTGVDGQVWLDTDGTLAGQNFVPAAGGTMTGNLDVPSINSGPIVGRNKILNGDFSIWQRGTSFLGSSDSFVGYTADRWYANLSDVTRENFTTGNAISGYEPQYFLKAKNRSGAPAGRFDRIEYRVEDVRTFAGQTITLSFWTKKLANKTGIMGISPIQDFGSGGSSRTFGTFIGVTYSGTGWERKSYTINLPSISGKTIGTGSYLVFEFYGNMGGTPDYEFDIWGVQVEAGSVATPFHTATPNQQTELAACQRYYYRATSENALFGVFGSGLNSTTTDGIALITLPVPMRTMPTSMDFSTIGATDLIVVNSPISSATLITTESTRSLVRINFVSSGLTAFRPTYVRAINSTSGFIGFSAEL